MYPANLFGEPMSFLGFFPSETSGFCAFGYAIRWTFVWETECMDASDTESIPKSESETESSHSKSI